MGRLAVFIVVVLLLLCCCLVLVGLGVGGYYLVNYDFTFPTPLVNEFPTSSASNNYGQPEFPSTVEPASQAAHDTLAMLQDVIVPNNDPQSLMHRLKGIDVPAVISESPRTYSVGDQDVFWVTNVDTDENFQIEAVLRYVTPHTYFWFENGIAYSEYDLQLLAETFEDQIYPVNREFFGSEWTPGIDHDPHLYIIFSSNLGYNLAGYFSSVDSVHPIAHEYSNAHETFMMNADNVGLDEIFTYGVLAHEFQHMIHWYQDRNESSWLNEGFSELAALLNGYYEDGFDGMYLRDPDLQLTDWPNDPNATTPHYGASFLFVTYFLDRLGEEATKALVAHPDNGMNSVDSVLQQLGSLDPETGQVITADDLFADWTIANYLNDPGIEDGRYAYQSYTDFSPAIESETYSSCPISRRDRTVSQYGVDYVELACQGDYVLEFEGVSEVGVLPADAYSGLYAFWSNKGDESDMMLTQEFDFRDVSGDLTLSYKVWYDLEEDYDYLYLLSSEDGEKWDIIRTPSGTDLDKSGNSYGWAYNGVSSGWFDERVDISHLAGKKVYLRFEYVTDAAVNGEGFLLDDVIIPEVGYSTDFENDDGGWVSAGFVRLQNRLPQTYRVSLIKYGSEISVESVELGDNQSGKVQLSFDSNLKKVVMVVSGTTRFTRLPAIYRFSLQ